MIRFATLSRGRVYNVFTRRCNEHSRSFPHRGLKFDTDNNIGEPMRGSKVGETLAMHRPRVESSGYHQS
jgi:hypothetical protein